MKTTTSIWIHWTLFAFALVAAGWVLALGYLQLDTAFEQRELTRQTLFETLVYVAAVLALLWAAGWIVASRPRAPRKVPSDNFNFG